MRMFASGTTSMAFDACEKRLVPPGDNCRSLAAADLVEFPVFGCLLVLGNSSRRLSLLDFTLPLEAGAILFSWGAGATLRRDGIAKHFRRHILIAYRLGAGSRSTPE
jgi:hypothetical protein